MYTLPALPYDYQALEPHIDEATMRLHHAKHHQAYVDKLNTALEPYPDLAEQPVTDLIRNLDQVPEAVRPAVRNHGGGHLNHSWFWPLLAPAGTGGKVSNDLAKMIDQTFGGMDSFKQQLTDQALAVFGSGWAWLVKLESGLQIITTPNQDSPMTQGLTPILGVDVWEHAYYLKYQNRRADYVAAWWQVINWSQVNQNWQQALSAV